MFNKSSNKQDLDITFIPLLVLYITSAINREQLIINGVLYSNWDNIKLIILYSSVIPRISSNIEIIMLMIKPMIGPNRLLFFSNRFKSFL